MTRRDKAILALICAAEIINCAKAGALKSRIADLETQRDIYASRAQHWIDRAVEDEEVIDSMQLRLDALADGKVELEDAGVFFCTAYCTEQYPHICGEGHGITASGQPIQAGKLIPARSANATSTCESLPPEYVTISGFLYRCRESRAASCNLAMASCSLSITLPLL